MTKKGILCKMNDKCVYLDPKNRDHKGINFISHAHMDHLPSKKGLNKNKLPNKDQQHVCSDHSPSKNDGVILLSHETNKIANLRGFEIEKYKKSLDGFSLIDSGHILGAKGLLFDDIFYTGDICTRKRGFLQGAKIPKCKTLITESTFGLPEFVFPTISKIQKEVNELISEFYGRGVPVILMGYELGKAQTITQLFSHWEPLYFHDSVKEMNLLHQKLGVPLKDGIGHSKAEKNGLLEKKPWVMVAPLMTSKNKFIQHMKSRYGVVTIGFTGWVQSSRFPFGRQGDYSIPMSDHCDFNELVDMVIQSGAEQVYTTHGFANQFAEHLKKIGIDAESLLVNS